MEARLKFENQFNNAFGNDLVYEFTNEKKYLLQYDQLIRTYYKKDLDLDVVENNMQDGIVDHSNNETIYIVRHGDRVIGGAKLSFAYIKSEEGLPMEEADYSVRHYLPEHYQHPSYGEIGRLVVDPTFRGKEVLTNMISNVMGFAALQQCGYLFVLAPALNSVLYRRVCRSLKIKIDILKDAPIPDKEIYRKLDMKLLTCDIRFQAEDSLLQQAAG